VLREYGIYKKLQDTPVPVPKTVAASEDKSILDCEFYIVERIVGETFHDGEPESFNSAGSRRAASETFVDVLASIHNLGISDNDLEDLGKPNGFTERQIEQWTKQLNWAQSYTNDVRKITETRKIRDWLQDNKPDKTPDSLVHGDFTLANVMFGSNDPSTIVAVFDWEMGTLGNPFTDVGWTLASWREASDPPNPAPDFLPSFTEKEGYLTRPEFIERYEAKTGMKIEDAKFYRVFGFYKLIAVCEMFFARYLRGADKSLYPKMEQYVPQITSRAMEVLHDD
jgi:aminoglycoside phosphotransferase (APT) family kinase protein